MILLDAKTKTELESAYQEALIQNLTLAESGVSDAHSALYFVTSPTIPLLTYGVVIYRDEESGDYFGDCSCTLGNLNLICPELGLAAHHYREKYAPSYRSHQHQPVEDKDGGEWFCGCGFPVIASLKRCPDCLQPKPEFDGTKGEEVA